MFTFTFAHAADEVKPPEEYVTFIRKLKKEMVKRGISQKTVDKVYEKNYYHPEPLAVKMDRKQAEFVLTTTDYLNRVLNQKRVETAQKKYKELYPLFKDLEKKYGVQFEYLVAFWGIETNFGSTFGNFEVIDALTTLAYDKRRRNFFKEELYQALKIIDTYDIDFEKMEGSWAGAMGHFQFMPSTFNAYAVDYDGDDKIDIWHSFEDAVASAANYLSKMGWNANEAWGAEVSLPWNFDYSQAARTKLKTVEEWGKLGVRTTNGKALSFNKRTKAAIILPEGSRGRAYIVLPNFSKIMKWNRSENYALAVSKLADYAKSGSKFKAFTPSSNPKLKTEDISNLQSFINKVGIAKIDEDGQLGSKTKEAVRKLQKEVKMPQDGYPDYRLLQKINNYNPDIGFVVPVQPQKAKKDSSKK
jgi:membrane-bound lytic murein transglycosylase B